MTSLRWLATLTLGFQAVCGTPTQLPFINSTVGLLPGGLLPPTGNSFVGAALAALGSQWLVIGAPKAGGGFGSVHIASLSPNLMSPQYACSIGQGTAGLQLGMHANFGASVATLSGIGGSYDRTVKGNIHTTNSSYKEAWH